MPRPRVRFTVRRMMVVVAVAAIIAGGTRWGVIRWRASEYQKAAEVYRREGMKARAERRDAMAKAYLREAEKYRVASEHPWLPVAPDPPEPTP